jgi:hypothetical protein
MSPVTARQAPTQSRNDHHTMHNIPTERFRRGKLIVINSKSAFFAYFGKN